jgi:hypothetical protein
VAATTTEEGPAHPGNGEATAAPQPPAQPAQQPNGSGEPRRPAISWSLNSDRTTRIELAVWLNNFTGGQGEQYEQASITLTRSYRDDDNHWQRGGSYRTHDLPVLTFLIAKAHAWAMERRTAAKMDGQEVPF